MTQEICSICKEKKDCNLSRNLGKGNEEYYCDECSYPKQIPFEVWSKNAKGVKKNDN